MVRVTDVPVVDALVQRVATQYSRNNHAKYATAGYLFQHPYRAYLLEGTAHLLDIVRHVHRAPLDMGITEDLDEYRWCSHRAYLGLDSPEWLNRVPVLELLGSYARVDASAVPEAVTGASVDDPAVEGTTGSGAVTAAAAADDNALTQSYRRFMSETAESWRGGLRRSR